jgi:hypothetical protein
MSWFWIRRLRLTLFGMRKDSVLAHLGFPKCGSTTLQRNFFPRLTNAEYIGVKGKGNLEYSSDEWSLLFETALIYYNDLEWDKYLHNARSLSHRYPDKLAFSLEHIIFDFFPNMVGLETRLRRLRQVFEDRINFILIVIRRPSDVVISLYKEYLRLGLPMGYLEFIEIVLDSPKFPRSFFNYGDVIKKVTKFFPEAHIQVEKLETLDLANLANILAQYGYKFDELPGVIDNENISMNLNEIASRIKFNKEVQFDLGASPYHMIESHRKEAYFNLVLRKNRREEDRFRNVILKRKASSTVEKIDTYSQEVEYQNFSIKIKQIFNEEDSLY